MISRAALQGSLSGAVAVPHATDGNVPWTLDILLQCTSFGIATNTKCVGHGTFMSEAVLGSPLPTVGGSGVFVLPYNSAPVESSGWDNTVTNKLDVQFTQTVGSGSLTVQSYIAEALN